MLVSRKFSDLVTDNGYQCLKTGLIPPIEGRMLDYYAIVSICTFDLHQTLSTSFSVNLATGILVFRSHYPINCCQIFSDIRTGVREFRPKLAEIMLSRNLFVVTCYSSITVLGSITHLNIFYI